MLAIRFTEIVAKHATTIFTSSEAKYLSNHDDSTIQTITIVGVSSTVPVEKFSARLRQSIDSLRLSGSKHVQIITQEMVERSLGKSMRKGLDYGLLENYLMQVEDSAQLVLYVARSGDEMTWFKTCLAHVSN